MSLQFARLDPLIAELDDRTIRELMMFILSMGLSVGYVTNERSNDFQDFLNGLPASNRIKKWLRSSEISLVPVSEIGAHFESLHAEDFKSFFSVNPRLVATTQKTVASLLDSEIKSELIALNDSLVKKKGHIFETFIGAGLTCLDAEVSSLAKCWNNPYTITKDEQSKYEVIEICNAFARVNPKIRIYDKLFLTCFLRRNRNGKMRTTRSGLLDAKDLLLQFLDNPELETVEIITEFNPRDGKIEYSKDEKDEAVSDVRRLLSNSGRNPDGLILIDRYTKTTNPCDKSHIWGSRSSLRWQHFAVSFENRTNTDITAIPSDDRENIAENRRQELVGAARFKDDW